MSNVQFGVLIIFLTIALFMLDVIRSKISDAVKTLQTIAQRQREEDHERQGYD